VNSASRWLFLAVLAWPVIAAVLHATLERRRERSQWLRGQFAAYGVLTLTWVGVLIGSRTGFAALEWNWSLGPASPVTWRFHPSLTSALWSLVVSLAAAISWSGTSGWSKELRVPPAAVWSVIGSTVWLSAAGNPLTLVTCWELCAVALWVLVMTGPEQELRGRAAGQMLLTTLLFDGLLITGAVMATLVIRPSAGGAWSSQAATIMPLLSLGMVIAAIGRIGLPPAAGWTRGLRDVDRSLAISFWWLGVVPSAAFLLQLAGQSLELQSATARLLSLVLGLVTLLGVVSAIARSRSGLIAGIPMFVAGLIGLAALRQMQVETGIGLYVFGFVLAVSVRPTSVPAPVHPEGSLMRLAAQDWSTPELWRIFVELPFRGAAQLLRFLDGLVFEQVVGGTWRRLMSRTAAAGAGRADDPAWLPALALLVATAVLIVMTAR
jgi:hypothetical protein